MLARCSPPKLSMMHARPRRPLLFDHLWPAATCAAGTKPLPAALKSVATHFQRYPTVGALTGELTVQRPYRTFLTAVQFCEWKVSHLMQKPIESICGFLTVLPGAFCAFRWAAVEVRTPCRWRKRRCSVSSRHDEWAVLLSACPAQCQPSLTSCHAASRCACRASRSASTSMASTARRS